jgi:hypothetical protein
LAGALSLLARKKVIAFVRRTGKAALLRMRPSAFTNVPGLPRCLAGPTERRQVRRGIGWVALNSSVWRWRPRSRYGTGAGAAVLHG